MTEIVYLDIHDSIRKRLKEDVLADFIATITYKEDDDAWYICAEPWPQYDDGLIQVRMPKKDKQSRRKVLE